MPRQASILGYFDRASLEALPEVNPKRRRSSGARGTFDFLQQPCKCQRRICWQQFQSEIEAVKSKRAELEGLPPHEKAATFQIQSLQFNFQGF